MDHWTNGLVQWFINTNLLYEADPALDRIAREDRADVLGTHV
jgi:hypothetical protein